MELLLNSIFLSDIRLNDIGEQQNNCHSFYFSVTAERTFSRIKMLRINPSFTGKATRHLK